MASLFINVKVAGTAPAGALANGTSLAVDVWAATRFGHNPSRTANPPSGAADATGTTDASGNATFTGLSSVMYWLRVTDARGIANWFPVASSRIPNTAPDPFVANIPWSTPTSVTAPADPRGGDTLGGPSGIRQYAPLLHQHEIPPEVDLPWGPTKFSPTQTGLLAPNDSPLVENTHYQNTSGKTLVIYWEFGTSATAAQTGGWHINISDDNVTYQQALTIVQSGGSAPGWTTSATLIVPVNSWFNFGLHDGTVACSLSSTRFSY